MTTSTGWRLPEVNIGIVCANAPVLRPLYLFYRGRLATQQRTSTSGLSGGGSGSYRNRMVPNNAINKYYQHDNSKDEYSFSSVSSPTSFMKPGSTGWWSGTGSGTEAGEGVGDNRGKGKSGGFGQHSNIRASEASVELGLPVHGASL